MVQASRCRTVVIVLSLIVFGTASSLLSKILYEVQAPDRRGHVRYFTKPWAATLLMFIGMAAVLPYAFIANGIKRCLRGGSSNSQQTQPLLNTGAGKVGSSGSTVRSRDVLMLWLPTLCDLLATALMSIGLLWVTASVYQMMRGAEMLFTAALSYFILRRPLNRLHLAGLLCCAGGITMVGIASTHSSTEGPAKDGMAALLARNGSMGGSLIGVLLIIAAQAVQSTQVVLEDHFMSDIGIEPMKVVGYEGLFGSALLTLVILPILQHTPAREGSGLHEDSLETIHMLRHSTPLLLVALLQVGVMALYNISGMYVTGDLGAVSRTVLETLRTLFVWLVDLLLFYSPAFGGGDVGEPWTRSSWVQALGFVVLVCGTLIYAQGDEHQHKVERQRMGPEAWAAAAAMMAKPIKAPMTMHRAANSMVILQRMKKMAAAQHRFLPHDVPEPPRPPPVDV